MTKRKSSEQDTEVVAEQVVETGEETSAEVETAEAGEVSAAVEVVQPEDSDSPPAEPEQEVVGQPAPAEEQRAVAEPAPIETPPAGMHLKTLAQNLYQMGLDLGLAPDEAAMLTAETRLPPFIGEEGEKEFKEGLVEVYQGMLDRQLQDLKKKIGLE